MSADAARQDGYEPADVEGLLTRLDQARRANRNAPAEGFHAGSVKEILSKLRRPLA